MFQDKPSVQHSMYIEVDSRNNPSIFVTMVFIIFVDIMSLILDSRNTLIVVTSFYHLTRILMSAFDSSMGVWHLK